MTAADDDDVPARVAMLRELWYEGLWSSPPDDGRIASLADDYRVRAAGSPEWIGKASLREVLVEYHEAVPDLEIEVVRTLADDDVVVVAWLATGTLEGALHGIEPTGRPFEIDGLTLHEFEGDELKASRIFYDPISALRQVGAAAR